MSRYDEDPHHTVAAWVIRMTARFGPKIWDQVRREWLTWEQALEVACFGHQRKWLLDTRVWSPDNAQTALVWEGEGDASWWPDWAVLPHLVDVRPCDLDDHQWALEFHLGDIHLRCLDPCAEPRIYIDMGGRYTYPACQNIPDLDCIEALIRVRPSWVIEDEESWWLELEPEIPLTEEAE